MTAASRLGSRGVALPETMIVVGLFLMTLFATVQYALLGYQQVSADGATFIAAHDTVAQYGAANASDASYTQKVVNAVFSGLRSATVSSIPNNGSYETDITVSGAGSSGIAGLMPTAATSTSREIEASASSANTNTPVGNCATAALNVVSGGTTVANGPVDLLQGAVGTATSPFQLGTNAAGSTVVNLASGTVSAHVNLLQTITTDLTATASALQTVSSILNGVTTGRAAGPLAALTGPLSALLQPVVAQALTGSLTSATLATVSASVTALLGPLVSQLGATGQAALFGTSTTPGLLGGNGGGLLLMLSNAEAALKAVDAGAPASC